MRGKGRGVVFLPLSPAVERKGYNERCCANARRMSRPSRGDEQRALSASPRNGDAKVPRRGNAATNAGNRFHTIPAQQLPAFARADTAPAKAASHKRASSATLLQGRPHAPDTALASNSAAPSPPLKGAALSTNNKPRTKGLSWWNLLANLTVMPLRQPMSKLILPNIQASWFGFSWACPS